MAGLYSGHLIKEQLGGATRPDRQLSKCFLWLAQYNGPKPLNIPSTFRTWTFWQYTDGVHGPEPHRVDGVGLCDRNQFNGSLSRLKTLGRHRARNVDENPSLNVDGIRCARSSASVRSASFHPLFERDVHRLVDLRSAAAQ
jgi:hypothetical protein